VKQRNPTLYRWDESVFPMLKCMSDRRSRNALDAEKLFKSLYLKESIYAKGVGS